MLRLQACQVRRVLLFRPGPTLCSICLDVTQALKERNWISCKPGRGVTGATRARVATCAQFYSSALRFFFPSPLRFRLRPVKPHCPEQPFVVLDLQFPSQTWMQNIFHANSARSQFRQGLFLIGNPFLSFIHNERHYLIAP